MLRGRDALRGCREVRCRGLRSVMRPIAAWPRGKPRRRRVAERHLLGIPRLCPHWEMSALRVLCKPRPARREAIVHRSSVQRWTPAAGRVVTAVALELEERFGMTFEVHFPGSGEFYFVASFAAEEFELAKGFAVVVSRRLPELWMTLGRLYVREGRFYRRRRGYMLELSPATNVHLGREMRAALKGML